MTDPTIRSRYRLALVREDCAEYKAEVQCSRPAEAAEFIYQLVGDYDVEALGAIFFDAQRRAVGHAILHVGSINRCVATTRRAVKIALEVNACSIIIFHNHPSGGLTPSAEDRAYTRRLVEACELFDLRVDDHIIVGPEAGNFTSFREKGMF